MSETNNLKLKKHDNPETNEEQFDIENYLNSNWDKLEEFATNVDGKVTEIQDNIEEINKKDIEQDNKIVELQNEKTELEKELKEIQEDFYQSSIRGQASGEYIHVEDSNNCRSIIGISGNNEQETRSGKNEIYIKDNKYVVSGISIEMKKGIITITGTANEQVQSGYIAINKTLTSNYIFKSNLTGTSSGLHIKFRYSRDGKTNYPDANDTFQFKENDTISQMYFVVDNGATINAIVKPQLEPGTNATEWEEYGIMPSPDYSSKIETLKDRIEVKIVNKNLTEIDEMTDFSISNVQFKYKNGKLNLNGTSNANISSVNNNFKKYFKFVLPAGSYTYSQKNSVNSNIFTYVLDFEDTSKRYVTANGNSVKKASFTLEKTTEIFIGIYSGSNVTFNNVEIELQIEEGSTATTYESHQEQTITIPIQQVMLEGDYFDFNNEEEVHIWNKLTLTGDEEWITSESTFSSENIYSAYLSVSEMEEKSKIYSTHFKNIIDTTKQYIYVPYSNVLVVGISKDIADDITAFKNYLKSLYNDGTPVEVYYKLATPIQLKFNEEQKVVVKELKNARTYKNVTNIYSTDKISPIINLDYAKDLETLLTSKESEV